MTLASMVVPRALPDGAEATIQSSVVPSSSRQAAALGQATEHNQGPKCPTAGAENLRRASSLVIWDGTCAWQRQVDRF